MGVDESSLRETLSNAGLKASKMLQMLADAGFDGAGVRLFSTQGIPDIALTVIIKYYAFEAGRYCTQQARAIAGTAEPTRNYGT